MTSQGSKATGSGIRDRRVVLIVLASIVGVCKSVKIQFEDELTGFFIKDIEELTTVEPNGFNDETKDTVNTISSNSYTEDTKFTVFHSSRLVSLKASFGPFLSKQTVPTYDLIADVASDNFTSSDNGVNRIAATPGQLKPHLLDLSAHIVTKEVRKHKPVLRVLFHTGQGGFGNRKGKRPVVCIVLTASLGNRTIEGLCSPSGKDGTCLGEVTIPSGWWPPITHNKATKQPPIVTRVHYYVQQVGASQCRLDRYLLSGKGLGGISLQSTKLVGEVPLVLSQSGYTQIASDDILHMLVPNIPLYPSSRIYIPTFLEQPRSGPPVTVVVLKCRARRGVRIAGIEETSSDWTLRMDLNTRGSIGTVTAFRKDASLLLKKQSADYIGPTEIFNWLFVIDQNESELSEGAKLVWHVKYQYLDINDVVVNEQNDIDVDEFYGDGYFDANYTKNAKLRHRLDIKKDDVQTVLPISKSWEIMNTAILTGRQVSQPMKIFIVSEAGKIADVTLHTSCHTSDVSALKVSSSCTSVYVDGSETRGALKAEVLVKYGTFSGQGTFTVWMSEIPLEVEITDNKLSLIKDWKVPEAIDKSYTKRAAEGASNDWRDHFEEQNKKLEDNRNKLHENFADSDDTCKSRYQQSVIRVFARFLAEDPDSGRREYFISRNSMLDVTALIKRSLRSLDARIASVSGTTIHGHNIGRTEIQVLSPITGHVLGSSEVKVLKNKETVSKLRVRVISGMDLQLKTLHSDNGRSENIYLLRTVLSEKLTSKYQEGLLDIDVIFSDGHSTPLHMFEPDHYYLAVDSLNPHVIAFAPVSGTSDPRVIAVGEGEGDLLSVSLELADDCHEKHNPPIASSKAQVLVQFTSGSEKKLKKKEVYMKKKANDNIYNKSREGMSRKHEKSNSEATGDLSEMLSNIQLKDDNSHVRGFDSMSSYDKRQLPANVHNPVHGHQMTPLEIGMYILLGVFCVAIAIFMASCFVYASKHPTTEQGYRGSIAGLSGVGGPRSHHSVQNAHDWVWLGRQTLDKSSVATSGSRDRLSENHTANSMRSRADSRNSGYPVRYPPYVNQHRNFEANVDINIVPNPSCDFSSNGIENSTEGYGFNCHSAKEMYAELPRRRCPRNQYNVNNSNELYQNQPLVFNQQNEDQSSPMLPPRSPFFKHKQRKPVKPHQSPKMKARRHNNPTNDHSPSQENESCYSSHSGSSSEQSRSSRPSVNSATFTRKKPVEPSQGDILPVGFPVLCSEIIQEGEVLETNHPPGFQNPWEALHLHASFPSSDSNELRTKFFNEDYLSDHSAIAAKLHLDLVDNPPPYSDLVGERQSPASALPPYNPNTNLIITPEHIKKPRGEYIPLNPDINKPSPPRRGAPKIIPDPFNVSDALSPPLPRNALSPNHIFSSSEDLNTEISSQLPNNPRSNDNQQTCDADESETDFSITDVSEAQETDNCSSACSVDSGELEMVDELPDPDNFSQNSSMRRKHPPIIAKPTTAGLENENLCFSSSFQPQDLNSVALGSLDYEQLMGYFESLKESSA